jgi:hypothetical protein
VRTLFRTAQGGRWLFVLWLAAGCSSTTTTPSPAVTTPSTFVMTWPTLTFPTTGLGAQARTPVVITLWNGGTSGVPVTSATDTDITEFPLSTTCDFSGGLRPQSGCTVTAQFTPSATGARTATLTISANSATQTFALNGTAVGPVNPQLTIDITSGPPSTVFTLSFTGGTPNGQLTFNTSYTAAPGNPGASFSPTAYLADANGALTIAATPDAPGVYENWITDESSGRSTTHVIHTVQP